MRLGDDRRVGALEQHAGDRRVPEGVQAVDIGIEADLLDDARARRAGSRCDGSFSFHGLPFLRNSSGALLGLPFAAVFNSAASAGEIDTL